MQLTTPPDEGHGPEQRLPCGCHPQELAESLGLPIDELMRSIDAGEVITVGLDAFFGAGARCAGPRVSRPSEN